MSEYQNEEDQEDDVSHAENILRDIGGTVFGQDDLARAAIAYMLEAIEEGDDELGETPVEIGWQYFMDFLAEYKRMEKAFETAWPSNGVLYFAIGYGLGLMDADDINSQTMIKAWDNFPRFKPYLSKWESWLITIAKNLVFDHFRHESRQPEFIYLDPGIALFHEEKPPIDHRSEHGWSIPIICAQWYLKPDANRRMMAYLIQVAYEGDGWIPPTSNEMARLLKVSKTTCYMWFQEFIKEVIEYESKG